MPEQSEIPAEIPITEELLARLANERWQIIEFGCPGEQMQIESIERGPNGGLTIKTSWVARYQSGWKLCDFVSVLHWPVRRLLASVEQSYGFLVGGVAKAAFIGPQHNLYLRPEHILLPAQVRA